jgi:peptide/nickel transport system permease protein
MKYKLLNFARHLGLMLLVVWTVVSLVTLLIQLVPGDPATGIRAKRPPRSKGQILTSTTGLTSLLLFSCHSGEDGFSWNGANNQYVSYWNGILHGDLGRSFKTDQPVVDMILARYPATIKLALAAMLIAIGIAIPLGVVSGSRKNSLVDNLASFVALLGISLPTFVIGPFLVYIFAVQL